MTESPQPAPAHWDDIGDHTFVFGIWLLYWVHRLLGRWPFRICAYPVVALHWACRPALRAISMQYLSRLQAATGALGHPASWRDSLRHVALFADTMLDKLLASSGRYKLRSVEDDQGERLVDSGLSKQGGLIIAAHVGCVELCSALAQREGFRINVLVHSKRTEQFNRIMRRLGGDREVEFIEVSDINPGTLITLSDKIAAGEFVTLSADRVPLHGGRTVEVDFLGHTASFPIGPWILASLLKCPVYFVTCLHAGPGYTLHIEKFADQIDLPRTSRDATIRLYAERYAAMLEALLRRSPYDWFNFFPFWDPPHAASKSAP